MSAFRTTKASGFPMDIWSRKWYKPPAVPSGWNSCRYLCKNIYTVTIKTVTLTRKDCIYFYSFITNVHLSLVCWKLKKFDGLYKITNSYQRLNGGESLNHPPYKWLWNFANLQSYIFTSFWHTVKPLLYRRPLNTDTSILQTVWFIKKKRLGPGVNTQSNSISAKLFVWLVTCFYMLLSF